MTLELRQRLQAALGDVYRIQKELGGGGMSRLFLAEEASLHRQVVIKVLPPEFTSDVSAARFQREIETAAHLSHPNILPVLTAGARDDLLYYVMPYVAGESLRHRLVREGKLPLADALQILREVADALAFAHGAGVLHRDIKPENILLQSGHATLTDFGVARAIAESRSGARLTETGMILGTPGYMSPEQVAGERSLDARADVYALAVVAYEMLAGAPPFQGPTAQAVLAAHLMDTPRPLTELRPDVPAALSGVIARALAKDPNERLRTAAEFRDALATTTTGAGRAWSRRTGVAAAAGVILVAAAAVYLGLRPTEAQELDANLVAVAPFDVVGEELQSWREGLVDLLARHLDGAGPLRTVSPTLTIKRWQGRADPASAAALAKRTGAGLAVFGQLVSARGDSVRLTASVMDVASGASVGDVDLRGAADDVERLADSVSVGLLAELGRTRPVGAARHTSFGTQSLPALRAFLRGEQLYRRARWDSALAAYEEAIRIDSAFGLAYHRQAQVLGWTGAPGDVTEALVRAGAHNGGLAPRESLALVVDSLWGASRTGLSAEGPTLRRLVGTAREAVRQYPDPESWHALGDLLYHEAAGPFAETPEETLHAFEQAIALDPSFGPAYEHIVDLTLELRSVESARSRVETLLQLEPEPDAQRALVEVLRLIDPRATRVAPGALRARLDSLSPDEVWVLAFYLRQWRDGSRIVLTVLEALADRVRSGAEFPRTGVPPAYLAISHLAVRGRLRDARRGLNPWPQLVAEMAMLGSLPADSVGRVFDGWLTDRSHAVVYALWWWAERGDAPKLDAVRGLAAERRREAAGEGERGGWRYVEAAAEPYRLLARGDTVAALAAFAALPDSLAPALTVPARLSQARLLGARGANAEAARVLDRYPLPSGDQAPSRVLWSLLRARAQERLGNGAQAALDYGYVVSAWRDADPELEPYLAEARDALARVTGERRR